MPAILPGCSVFPQKQQLKIAFRHLFLSTGVAMQSAATMRLPFSLVFAYFLWRSRGSLVKHLELNLNYVVVWIFSMTIVEQLELWQDL
jgi:hypothetical protein